MVNVFIPTMLRKKCNNINNISVDGINLREIINNLELHCPGIEEILVYENLINPGIQIAVNGEPVTTGLATIVPEDAEINIIPAISGG
jgi:molybdopterin converting factor small subunit